jgi:hypothetical protein
MDQLNLPMELIDTIRAYDSYDLFDFYGMTSSKNTCPIIQSTIQEKRKINTLLSEKSFSTSYENDYSPLEWTFQCNDSKNPLEMHSAFCGNCGNYLVEGYSIKFEEFKDRDYFQDPRMCSCIVCYEMLFELTYQSGRSYLSGDPDEYDRYIQYIGDFE